MTRPIRQASHDMYYRRQRLGALLLALTASLNACAQPPEPEWNTAMKQIDFWKFVDYMPTRLPLKEKAQAEKLFNTVLVRTETSNEYSDHFRGGPVHLADGVEIVSVDLRINKAHPGQSLLVLTMGGKCIDRSVVLERQQGMRITNVPRGRSLDEETSWSQMLAWGKLSFGFTERQPDCLKSLVFATP